MIEPTDRAVERLPKAACSVRNFDETKRIFLVYWSMVHDSTVADFSAGDGNFTFLKTGF